MSADKPAAKPPRLRSLRLRLLLVLNLLLVLGLALLVTLDYRHELWRRLEDRERLLKNQAVIMLPPLARLHRLQNLTTTGDQPDRPDAPANRAQSRTPAAPNLRAAANRLIASRNGGNSVESVINVIRQRVASSTGSGQFIAVRAGDTLVIAEHDASWPDSTMAAVERAAAGPPYAAMLEGKPIVVGTDTLEDTTIYIAEYLSDAVTEARHDLFMQMLVAVGLGLGLTLAVNMVVFYELKPLRKLADTVRRIGSGELGAQAPPTRTRELQTLVSEINNMSQQLYQAQEQHRLAMNKARRIQENLHPHMDQGWRLPIQVRHISASEVAGDYFDLSLLPEDRVLLCLADVTGHGIPAAMGAAMLKVLFSQAARHSSDPADILKEVNQAFFAVSLEEDFASMAVAVVDLRLGRLTYASAGHEPALILTPDTPQGRCLDATGPLLGIDPQSLWETLQVDISPGHRLLLWTDGLVETRSPDGRFFRRDMVQQIVAQHTDTPLEQLCNALVDAADAWRGGKTPVDDVTLLALEMRPLGETAPVPVAS